MAANMQRSVRKAGLTALACTCCDTWGGGLDADLHALSLQTLSVQAVLHPAGAAKADLVLGGGGCSTCCTFAFGWVRLKGLDTVPVLDIAPPAGTLSESGEMQSLLQCSGRALV